MATVARARRTTATYRAEVIAYAVEHGTIEAGQRYGHKAATVRSWCSRAGVATVTSERMTAAVESHRLSMEERRTRLADRLLEIAEMSAEQAGPLIAEASLRELVGAWDYAIKNSQLLSGGATTRTEHGVEPVHAVADELAKRLHAA